MSYPNTTKATGFLGRLAADKEGAVFLMAAFGMAMMLAGITLAVEMGGYSREKTRFRNAVDQALLAAASGGTGLEEAKAYATQYFNANLPQEGARLSNVQFDVTSTEDRSTWTAHASADLKTSIAGIIGVQTLKLDHTAKVEWDDSVKNEVVAIVDVSGTMCAQFERGTEEGSIAFRPDPQCIKLHKMQEALKKIVDIGVAGLPAEPVFKVGVVPFTYKVRLPGTNGSKVEQLAPFLLKAEKDAAAAFPDPNSTKTGDINYFSNYADAEAGGPPLPEVYGLKTIRNEDDKQSFRYYIDHLVASNAQQFNRLAWKRSALGAQMAGLMLDPRYTALFGGDEPRPFGAEKTRKVVILMTDSVNTGCCFTNWPANDFTGNYIYSYSEDHKHLVGGEGKQGVCQQMKDAGIEIFTVLLDVGELDANARGREILDSFEQCASTAEDTGRGEQHAFRIGLRDQASLENAYQVIGRSLLNLRLTY